MSKWLADLSKIVCEFRSSNIISILHKAENGDGSKTITKEIIGNASVQELSTEIRESNPINANPKPLVMNST